MSLTTKMLIFFFLAFVIGSFISGIVESNAVGAASQTAGIAHLFDTWTQSSSGVVGKVASLAISGDTWTTLYNMMAWNYSMFASGIGAWVKFLICIPISGGLAISLMIVLAQTVGSFIP